MATLVDTQFGESLPPLSGNPIGRAIDRWIYVFMAASYIVITLVGFIPDSVGMVAAAKAGKIPPFPIVLHVHAALMGSFLLLMLAQTTLVATGRTDLHRRLGRVGMVLIPLLVLVGLVLVPTIYHSVWYPAQSAPSPARAELQQLVRHLDNIMLFQLRIGLVFPFLIFLGLRARTRDYAFHKRMMILATAVPMPAAVDRMAWLPTTLPVSPLAPDLYILAIISPMLVWDLVRTRKIHRAYLVAFGAYVVVSIALYAAWNTAWWHATAPRLMGV